ncbi:MAG: peptide deformylase [Parcubacteria group bacterium]|nr:peptide deformylase [Parcubacteria group bacterium]
MVKILQKDDPLLRGKAEKVPVSEIGSKKIKEVIHDMKEAMVGEKDAVAIAAPQIGVPLRIFVVAGKIFEKDAKQTPVVERSSLRGAAQNENKINAEQTPVVEQSSLRGTAQKKENHADIVFINPEITRRSRKKITMDEGCLSVRWWYGGVERAEKATVHAYDENGTRFTRGASGLLAQIFQHETDHLDGVLFIDKASNLHEELPGQKN